MARLFVLFYILVCLNLRFFFLKEMKIERKKEEKENETNGHEKGKRHLKKRIKRGKGKGKGKGRMNEDGWSIGGGERKVRRRRREQCRC